ncbi:MAG: shikimate kinase, partial [Acidobacteria bacterium]|nr:shikimate kinase [Acidobacteriota bacterium]
MTYKHNPDGAAEADPSSVILIGPTGVGKTAVGSALARLLGCPFIDSDHVISLRHGPVSNLYAVNGEAAFRRTEAETIASLVGSEPRPFILSLGGGAVTDPGTCELLRGLMVVWLDTDLKSVLPRLQAQAHRPLFAGDLAGRWQRNADARNGLYA